jgi:hypothetical protein
MILKSVKKLIYPVLWLVLFSFLAEMMVSHFRHIAHSRDQMDEEIEMLKDAYALLPADAPVAFATNINDTDMATYAYYQTQFAYCPHILSTDASQCNHIIFFRSYMARDSDIGCLHHCDTLYEHSGGSFSIMVLRKHKLK